MITLKLPFGLIKNKEIKKLYFIYSFSDELFFNIDPNFWPTSSSFLSKELLLHFLQEKLIGDEFSKFLFVWESAYFSYIFEE